MNSLTDRNDSVCAVNGVAKRSLTPPRLLICAAIFGILFSALFTNQGFGLNFTLFVFLIYIFAVFNSSYIIRRSFRQETLMYLFTIPVLLLSVLLFTSSTVLNVLSVLVILFVMYVQYIALSGNALNQWDEGGFIVDLVLGSINRFLFGLIRFVGDSLGTLFKGKKKSGVFIGFGIGVLLLLIVVPLLVFADVNMSKMFGRFIEQLAIGDIFVYVFLFIVGASFITAPASTALEPERTGPRKAINVTDTRPIQASTTGVALTMIAVVYVIFASVQFGYFFTPQETIASVLGLTSSIYAVRGFGELIFITCLNFVLILVAMRFTQQKDGKTQPYLKALYVLLIVFNFVILASSHLRMQSYENAFGYSVARFLSHSFMLLLVILNTVMLARIFSDKVKLVRLFVAAVLVYFCVIAVVNPESYVTGANISRYEQTGKIDMEYLFSLPGDALVQTCDFAETHPEEFSASVRSIASQRLDSYSVTDWLSLNLAEQRAQQRLQSLLEN